MISSVSLAGRRGWLAITCSLLLSLWLAGPSVALAAQEEGAARAQSPFTVPSPGAELWRGVRHSVVGKTQVTGVDSGVLVDRAGDDWRTLRNEHLFRYSGTFLGIMLGMVVLYYLLHGSIRIEHGRSGETVERWAGWERALHWYTAALFVVLALTGLSLLFGRLVLIPVLGREAFGAWASVAKTLHNYLGPLFIIGVLVMVVGWIRHNVPKWVDVVWFLKAGGMFGKIHPSAERLNAGEKAWFWFICSVGLVACVSGIVLDFPDLARSRADMQLANIVHAAATVAWIGAFFGHAYMGTLGTEGALEGMVRGRVDVNWAKQHHDLWYEELGHGELGHGELGHGELGHGEAGDPEPGADAAHEAAATAGVPRGPA
jgi:formate dehydrogenase subunit gamma